jgi:uncharacterized protein (TIGR00725 family)
VAVVGGSECSPAEADAAEAVGRRLAEAGAVVLCGGLTGVMEAVAKGARAGGGLTIGILPGNDPADANPFIDVPLATGMGEMRNALIIRAARAVIAIAGGWGTLSEIALAQRIGTPVVGLHDAFAERIDVPRERCRRSGEARARPGHAPTGSRLLKPTCHGSRTPGYSTRGVFVNKSLIIVLVLLGLTAESAVAQNPAPSPAPAAAPAAAPQRLPADSLEIARRYANWFLTYQADSLFAHLPPDARQQVGSSADMSNQMMQFAAQAGTETELVEERWVRRNGKRQYWRKAVYSTAPEPVLLRLVILPDGSLGGIGLSPASQPPRSTRSSDGHVHALRHGPRGSPRGPCPVPAHDRFTIAPHLPGVSPRV